MLIFLKLEIGITYVEMVYVYFFVLFNKLFAIYLINQPKLFLIEVKIKQYSKN
jgi:hypothetical protein